MPSGRRASWPVVALAIVAIVAAVAIGVRASRHAAVPAASDAPSADVAAAPPVEAPAAAGDESASAPDDESADESGGEPHPPELAPDEEAGRFQTIDLDAARAALPDNLYWDTAAPTTDPRLLGDRERAKTYWNEQYGKMLSGTGTEEEIQAYFDRRMRVSSDYVRFCDWVLEHQGSELSEQDQKLLHLARRLHLARLQEVPRKMQEAFDRKAKQDAAREAWLAEQRELDEQPPPSSDTEKSNDVP